MYHGGSRNISPLLLHLIQPLLYGRIMVDIFIVLSGFCLMIPVVSSQDKTLRGGIFPFLIRRARRILPPYYAALAFMILTILALPYLQRSTGTAWDITQPSLLIPVVASHLFLIHNWSPEWIYKIDTPLWSVATEWQIYFLFPFLLLPAWRRGGALLLLAAAGAVSGIPLFILGDKIELAVPWFILLFAGGIAGADAVYNHSSFYETIRKSEWWPKLFLISGGILAFCLLHKPQFWSSSLFVRDLGMGAFTVTLIVTGALYSQEGKFSGIGNLFKLLGSQGMLWLGACSYSLYLVHYPVVSLMNLFLHNRGYSANITLLLLLTLGVPISIACARIFYLLFERPFLKHKPL